MAAYVGGSSFAANLPRYAEQISIQFTFILNFIKVHLDVSIFLSIILLGYYIINQIRSSVNNNQSKNRLRNSQKKIAQRLMKVLFQHKNCLRTCNQNFKHYLCLSSAFKKLFLPLFSVIFYDETMLVLYIFTCLLKYNNLKHDTQSIRN